MAVGSGQIYEIKKQVVYATSFSTTVWTGSMWISSKYEGNVLKLFRFGFLTFHLTLKLRSAIGYYKTHRLVNLKYSTCFIIYWWQAMSLKLIGKNQGILNHQMYYLITMGILKWWLKGLTLAIKIAIEQHHLIIRNHLLVMDFLT